MISPAPDWLMAFPELAVLDDPSAREALGAMRPVRLPAGEVTFRDGDACRHYVLVVDGSIRVQKVSESGREIVLYRVERGQTCVLTTSCLFAGTRYAAEGITETPVTAVLMPLAVFNAAIAGSAGFRRFVFASFGERIAELMLLIEAIAFGRVDERLAERLVAFDGGQGPIELTHQQLAAELGTAREVVSRLLKEFERRGWVGLTRGRIALTDRTALSALARGLPAGQNGV